MTKQDINEILTNPDALALLGVGELRSLCYKYPYVQAFHLLLVKKLYSIKSPTFETALHMAATYVLDRKFLYDYLHTLSQTKSLPPVVNNQNNDALEIVKEGEAISDNDYDEWVEEIDVDENQENPEQVETSIEADIDERLKAILNRFSNRDENQHLKNAVSRIRNMELGGGRNPKTETEIPEEQRILYLTEDLEEIKEDGLETPDLFSENQTDWEEERLTTSIEFVEDAEEIDSEESTEAEDERLEQLKLAIRKKHIERLRKSVEAYFKLSEEEIETSDEVKVIQDIPSNMSFKEWFGSLRSMNLRDEAETPEPEDQSLEKDEDVMSEALAELLASQGNKERAVQMYQHLILKFPEKKRFFALKIEDLRE